MSDQTYNYDFVEAAAKEFMQQNPAYVPTAANFKKLTDEVSTLIAEENADPQTVATFTKAFHRCAGKLELKVADPIKTFDEMTVEELQTLSPKEKDKLPDHLLKRMANHELAEKRKRPQLSEVDVTLRELFSEAGYADSNVNKATVHRWMQAKQLGYSLSNLRLGIEENSDQLDLSAAALDRMSADDYKNRIVLPDFKKQQAAKAKQPTHERGNPPGFSYVSWLHNQ